MRIVNPSVRRGLTVVVVGVSLLVGLGAIRAAAAWTAAAAPLTASPVSVQALQARISDEHARSADLVDKLAALTTYADELAVALAAAESTITADTVHAAQLEMDLSAAKTKLAALERSIRKATNSRVVTTTRTTRTALAPVGGGDDDEHEEHDDD